MSNLKKKRPNLTRLDVVSPSLSIVKAVRIVGGADRSASEAGRIEQEIEEGVSEGWASQDPETGIHIASWEDCEGEIEGAGGQEPASVQLAGLQTTAEDIRLKTRNTSEG